MRAVLQRVSQARVRVEGETCGEIGPGLMVLLGVSQNDTPKDAAWLAAKTAGLRIFPDSEHKLNLSLTDIRGEALVVSQFTLWGDCNKGRRPSFVRAAGGEKAEKLYLDYVAELKKTGLSVATGRFGAMMEVSLVNQGPVTLLLDSEKTF